MRAGREAIHTAGEIVGDTMILLVVAVAGTVGVAAGLTAIWIVLARAGQ